MENSPLPPRVPATIPPKRGGIVAFLSNQERRGAWTLPRHMRIVAVFGSCELDLRGAHIQPGVNVIEVVAFCASVEVIAPPGVRVECEGETFLGNYGIVRRGRKRDGYEVTSPDAPVVRLVGRAILASVEGQLYQPKVGAGKRLTAGDE